MKKFVKCMACLFLLDLGERGVRGVRGDPELGADDRTWGGHWRPL